MLTAALATSRAKGIATRKRAMVKRKAKIEPYDGPADFDVWVYNPSTAGFGSRLKRAIAQSGASVELLSAVTKMPLTFWRAQLCSK
jgi:hypothetical protein